VLIYSYFRGDVSIRCGYSTSGRIDRNLNEKENTIFAKYVNYLSLIISREIWCAFYKRFRNPISQAGGKNDTDTGYQIDSMARRNEDGLHL